MRMEYNKLAADDARRNGLLRLIAHRKAEI